VNTTVVILLIKSCRTFAELSPARSCMVLQNATGEAAIKLI
jgi:hypothetical protein